MVSKRLLLVVKPFKVDAVVRALVDCGADSITFEEARGYGRQKGHLEAYRNEDAAISFLPKVRFECAVPEERVEEAIRKVGEAARTGRIGDGKIFVGELE
ncbi:MAG: P-II family nitrogen regulator [Planctomycetota bacterium]